MDVSEKAKEIRRLSLLMSSKAGSGHPTSSLSAADLIAVLFNTYFRFDIHNPHSLSNDRLIFSKGHASPLFYAAWSMTGIFPKKDLEQYRTLESDLEGHPTPRLSFVDAATGSLGQGLSIAAGMALAALKDERSIKVYCLLGDGEMAEGSVWEALNFASYYTLNNLVAIVDVNRLAQSDPTMLGHDVGTYEKRIQSFGWETSVIDGHNYEQITQAFAAAQKATKPFAIIAKTIKGKGISFLEDKDNWHGKALKEEELKKALEELDAKDGFEDNLTITFDLGKPHEHSFYSGDTKLNFPTPIPSFEEGEMIATREVYGKALAKFGEEYESVFALDADVKNSTFSMDFKTSHPDRFVECFIAEQNMLGVALGLSKQGKVPFVSTFAAFLTRAFDQIRMSAVSMGDLKICGSHAGVSIGEDGPSQMGLEDIAMFATVPNSTIFHPSDAVSAYKLVFEQAKTKGISYLRTLRPKTQVLYDVEEEFIAGGSKILRESENDEVVLVAAGITVHEALKAHELLQNEGINVTVIDAYSIKPIDKETIVEKAHKSRKKTIITVEDHYYHGGLGDMVLNAVSGENLKVEKLAVSQVSHSGEAEELLKKAGIDSSSIVSTIKQITR